MEAIKNNRPIGVFDSGIGGLSILKELEKLLPQEDFVFLGDQKNVPYGEKTKRKLVSLMYRVTNYLTEVHSIKMMVIACNTATCYTISELREKYHLPLVGTEPAIKPASLSTKTRVIAVISTPATSKSKTLKRLIGEFATGITVINIGCKNLENTVEQGNVDDPRVKNLLKKHLKRIKNSKADRLVLGCTHYPFLTSAIASILGRRVKLIDSGKAIARRAKSLLKNKAKRKGKGRTSYFTTGDPDKFGNVASKLLGKQILAKKIIL